jgi:trimeric autotransporter adhesin
VQPFTWRTAEGSSVLHSATFRLDRRQIRGVGGGVQYTIAQSRDNSPSIGGGGGGGNAVAQNDQDIASEWGRSNFDQRHRFTARVNAELPFGPNRPWLADGGFAAALLQSWRVQTSFSMDAGSPLTVRVRGAARDVSSGLNGALRADLTGDPLTVSNPTIDQFFNTEAFTVPAPGLYGTSGRNLITGPGSKRLDASFSRDVRMGGNRTVSIQMSVNNLLNMVNYSSVDTWVNSPTFGQVLGVRSMRSATLNLRFRY